MNQLLQCLKSNEKKKYPSFHSPVWLSFCFILTIISSITLLIFYYSNQNVCGKQLTYKPPNSSCRLFESMFSQYSNRFSHATKVNVVIDTNWKQGICDTFTESDNTVLVWNSDNLMNYITISNYSNKFAIQTQLGLAGLYCVNQTFITLRMYSNNGNLSVKIDNDTLDPCRYLNNSKAFSADLMTRQDVLIKKICLQYELDNHIQECEICNALDLKTILLLITTGIIQIISVSLIIIRLILDKYNGIREDDELINIHMNDELLDNR